ncbi:TIGR01457 family HAD-type hydrolase [Planococcus sp. ISL-109]|uniref:TIGR01457 family HAD-type hydrolase n=1 Tax=Planococcus sp. ISL-109 TaxID=2819166 RepID=UPI001BE734DB|nr:TIGR01457 family HAD-type hydrolase [Planococcus sp. ISL-109]MBT2583653.1 TIGR01457 family HAD-type hydrolase [Planococcus sp. ISL-109]
MAKIKRYKAYCLDLDGTVYRGNEPVVKAAQFVASLQESGIEPFYITNNASMTVDQLHHKLEKVGVHAEKARIMSSAIAAAKYIRRWYPDRTVFLVGSKGLEEALDDHGINRVEKQADIVLMGLDPQVNYDKLARACLEVQRGAVFLSTNRDLKFPTERGLLPGNGAFTALVAQATDIDPVFIGKPEIHMLEAIHHEYGFRKEDMVMIGDNYDTDIQAGLRFGIDTVHVNTGVTPMEAVLEKDRPASFVLENLGFWEH